MLSLQKMVQLSCLPVILMLSISTVQTAMATAVVLQNGTATFSQSGFTPDQTYDSNLGTFWAIAPNTTSSQVIVWEAASDVVGPLGSSLTFNLKMSGIAAQHTFSHFRILVTGDNRSTFADGFDTGGDVSATWTQLTSVTASDTGGATLAVNGDTSISVSGPNPADNDYTVTGNSALTTITGFRLEAFNSNGFVVGRGTGNITLTEFQVDAVAIATPEPSGIFLALVGIAGLWRMRRK